MGWNRIGRTENYTVWEQEVDQRLSASGKMFIWTKGETPRFGQGGYTTLEGMLGALKEPLRSESGEERFLAAVMAPVLAEIEDEVSDADDRPPAITVDRADGGQLTMAQTWKEDDGGEDAVIVASRPQIEKLVTVLQAWLREKS